jgi:hypothetical protein
MGCPPFSKFLQNLVSVYKLIPVLSAFGLVSDAITDISPPVRLYSKMYVMTAKR